MFSVRSNYWFYVALYALLRESKASLVTHVDRLCILCSVEGMMDKSNSIMTIITFSALLGFARGFNGGILVDRHESSAAWYLSFNGI